MVQLTAEMIYFLIPIILVNIGTLLGFYFTTKQKMKTYDDTIADLKTEIINLNKKIDTLTLQLIKYKPQ